MPGPRRAVILFLKNMAPKKQPPAPPKVGDVRTALLHLAELAAASEGRGLDVSTASSPDADHAVLATVTRLLLKHREKQRLRQRDAELKGALASLTLKTARFYRDDSLTSHDLEQAVRGSLRPIGLEPTDQELDALLPDDRGLEPRLREPDSIKARGGPAEAAKHALANAVGFCVRTIATTKTGDSLSLRTAFGRVVSRKGVRDYLVEVSDTLTSGVAPPIPLAALAAMDEATGSALDRTLEDLAHEVLTQPWVVYTACLDDHPAPEMRALRCAFEAEVDERCLALTLVAAILAGPGPLDPDLVAQFRSYLSELAPSVVEVFGLLTLALQMSDVPGAEAARRGLRTVVKNETLQRTSERWRQRAAQFGAEVA